MKPTKNKILIATGWLLTFISILLVFVGTETEVIGETPCVDGMNRVNLESIMCENKVDTWFGYDDSWMFSVLILTLIGMAMVAINSNSLKEKREQEAKYE